MKKVLAVALLCAVAAFAVDTYTWDKFPAKDAGQGEFKVGVSHLIDPSSTDIPFGIRYSIITGLEIAASSGYDITGEGLDQPNVGVRYWLPMGLGFFLNVGIPIEDYQNLRFNLGAQYFAKISEELVIGSELGLTKWMDVDPMILNVGVEVDYSLGSITPFLGLDLDFGIGEYSKDLDMDVSIGGIFEINEMFTVDAYAVFGGLISEGDIGIVIGADLSINF